MSRFDYVKYDIRSQDMQAAMKDVFESLEELILKFPGGRSQSLALTSIEEAYMWVGKMIRDEQINRNGSAPLQEGRKNG